MLGHSPISGAPVGAIRRALFVPGRIASPVTGKPLVPAAFSGAVRSSTGLVGAVLHPASITGVA